MRPSAILLGARANETDCGGIWPCDGRTMRDRLSPCRKEYFLGEKEARICKPAAGHYHYKITDYAIRHLEMTSFIYRGLKLHTGLEVAAVAAVAATGVDEIALLGCGTDTAAITAQRRTAALGLALIVLEVEQIVGADLHWRARERHIGVIRTEALGRRRQTRGQVHTIIRADGGRAERRAGRSDEVIHELLYHGLRTAAGPTIHDRRSKTLARALGPVRHAHQHEQIRHKEKRQHTDQIPRTTVHLPIVALCFDHGVAVLGFSRMISSTSSSRRPRPTSDASRTIHPPLNINWPDAV